MHAARRVAEVADPEEVLQVEGLDWDRDRWLKWPLDAPNLG